MELSFKTFPLQQGKVFQFGYEIGYFIGQNWVIILILTIIFVFLLSYFIGKKKNKKPI